MASISLCMIVKNEEDVLARCLDSVKDIVDEIIIVDTGSTDNTKEIARKYTDNVYDFEWIYDFSAARNFSFSKATKEYIMWLDADDVLLEKDRILLKKFKNKMDTNIDVVMMKYNVSFDENGNPTMSYYRERIIRKDAGLKWISPIHEIIPPTGNIVYKDIAVTHKKLHASDPKRNLTIFKKMIEDGIDFDARQQFYYARELYYNEEYEEAIIMFQSFLENEDGWIENKINACIDMSYCFARLNDDRNVLNSLLYSFKFDIPRAEVCCEIGHYFNKDERNFKKAIYWYKEATRATLNVENGGFSQIDCYGYIPYLQLCVIYYRLGDLKRSIFCNEQAGRIKPNDTTYLNNKKFFHNIRRI